MLLLHLLTVVYHYNPTSNRNYVGGTTDFGVVVYHYNPTSNRNYRSVIH